MNFMTRHMAGQQHRTVCSIGSPCPQVNQGSCIHEVSLVHYCIVNKNQILGITDALSEFQPGDSALNRAQ